MQIEQSIEKGEVLFTGTFTLKIIEVHDIFTLPRNKQYEYAKIKMIKL